ncbi:MarR family transcriptional regulator [Nocardia sp. CA2R105]|uniref:MarR family winged helix-turn-helix transcriptional regulator n=1 Tax=Nocardia coffeae TaxID=2873381 RepID=UPI001CA6AF9C|nr:MarR family transcriptional regulator [Nocardia coffeae]MBY8859784.1 MarR family transcriptional regulator [Nocardia coffeae]
MKGPVDLVEFESMLLTKYTLNPRFRSGNGLLERSAYLLLSRIELAGPQSIRQFGDALRLDASTLNRQTRAMLRDRLVERIADPDGGIARKFQLTEAGRRRLHAARAVNVEGMTRVMADWSDEDITAFATYLRRFNMDIESLDGRAWPHPDSRETTPANPH